MAQKARKPQAAQNGPKKAHPCDHGESSLGRPGTLKIHIDAIHLNRAAAPQMYSIWQSFQSKEQFDPVYQECSS